MSKRDTAWAGRLRNTPTAIEALATLRLVHGLQAIITTSAIRTEGGCDIRNPSGRLIWVRGPRLEAHHETLIRRIPWEAFYEVFEGDRIRRPGRILPELADGKLPGSGSEEWRPLAEILVPSLPTSPFPGRAPVPVSIQLRPDTTVREVSFLEATTQDWLAFANEASEIRLRNLIWALDPVHPETVLIRGAPLPPVPGKRWVEDNGVVVPAGQRWWPAVSAETLRKALGVAATELALLGLDGRWSRMPRTAWLPGNRSTIRLVLANNPSVESLQ